jgi:trimethylamine:corrinoid methyltransferase-like protein
MATNLQLRVLSSEEVGNMFDKCLHLLSAKGVNIDHPEALKALAKAGVQVDMNNRRARFPKNIIEEALRTVPKSVTLGGQEKENDFVLPDSKGPFRTRTGTGAPEWIDPETNTFQALTIDNVAEWGQLGAFLDEIDTIAFPSPQDVPEETADIHALKTLFENTTKHVITQPYNLNAVKYLLELAVAAAGSKEELKKRPVMSILACTLPPFTLDSLHTEVIMRATELGVPIFPNPLAIAGATSPVTPAGTVLQSSTEILAQLVMSQVLQPGTPVIAQPVYFSLDMTTGKTLQATLESVMGSAMNVQFIKEAFHVPTKTWGFGTDSYTLDGQNMLDDLLRGLLVALAGGDLLLGAGNVNVGIEASPVQMIIDNKLIKIYKRVLEGIKVDDDYLAWKEILDTEPGGHYLELAHTLRHCREALRTGLSITQPRDTWMAEGSKDLHARMREEYQEVKKQLQPRAISEDLKKELNNIVKQADKDLVK